MFAHAHMTDWDLADEELQVIKEKTDIFVDDELVTEELEALLDKISKKKTYH